MLDSGLVRRDRRAPVASAARTNDTSAHDFLEMISSWQIQSSAENVFTLNGKEYPATQTLDVHEGRALPHSLDQHLRRRLPYDAHARALPAASSHRDAQPVADRRYGRYRAARPGQRVDVVVNAEREPGTWLVHCHVIDHIEDATGMPAGLITAIHYAGTPNLLTVDVSRDGAGDEGRAPRALSFWYDVVARRDRRLDDLRRPADRACAKRLAANGRACSTRSRSASCSISSSRSRRTPSHRSRRASQRGTPEPTPFPSRSFGVFVAGLLTGLVGLGSGGDALRAPRRRASRKSAGPGRDHRHRHRRAQLRRRAWPSARRRRRGRRRSRSR